MKITVKDCDKNRKVVDVFFDQKELDFFDKMYMLFFKIAEKNSNYREEINYEELTTKVEEKQLRWIYYHSLLKTISSSNFIGNSFSYSAYGFMSVKESIYGGLQVHYSLYRMLRFFKYKTPIEYIIQDIYVNVFIKFIKKISATWSETYLMLEFLTNEEIVNKFIRYATSNAEPLTFFSEWLLNKLETFTTTVDAYKLNYTRSVFLQERITYKTHNCLYRHLFELSSILTSEKTAKKIKGFEGDRNRIIIRV